MASAFGKDLRRSITHSWGRFLAIAIIAALGAGFYAGLRMTGPDMRLAGDEYYDGTSLADVRVVSTIGFAKPTPFQNWMACNIRCASSRLMLTLPRRARATMASLCNRATVRI